MPPLDLSKYKVQNTSPDPNTAKAALGHSGELRLNLAKYKTQQSQDSTVQTPEQKSDEQHTAVANAVESVFPGKQIGQTIGTLAGYGISKAKDIWNGLTGKKTDIAENYNLSAPTLQQNLGDIAKGTAMVAGTAVPAETLGTAGTIGTEVGLGALGGAGQGMTEQKGAGGTAKEAGIGAVTGGLATAATEGLGSLFGKIGTKGLNTLIKPLKSDIEDGFSMNTIKKYDLGGSLNTMYSKTQATLSDLTTQLNQKLKGSNETIDLKSMVDKTIKDLSSGSNKLKGFGSNTKISGALEQLKSEVSSLGEDAMKIPDAQIIKQAAGHYGSWQFGRPDPEAKASETVYNTFYKNLKKEIEDKSPPGVQEINKKISELIPVSNALVKRIPVADRNSMLSLGDMISLTASVFDPKALGLSLINFASKSGSVLNKLTKAPGALESIAPAIGAGAVNTTNQIQ